MKAMLGFGVGGGHRFGGLIAPATPSFEFNAARGALPAGVVLTRATGAMRVDHRGYIEEVAAGDARFTYDPALTYNELPDPWFDACVVGAAAPIGLRFQGAGLGSFGTVVGKGVTSDGLPYVEIEGTGTPSLTDPLSFVASIPCVVGETVSGWVRVAVLSSRGFSSSPALRLADATASVLTSSATTIQSSLELGTEYTATGTRTAADANTTAMAWAVQFGSCTVGVPISARVRLVFPILHHGAAPVTESVPLAALAARIGTTPQYGLLGLLLEEGSTNALVNPRGEGVVAGTIGTTPTGWIVTQTPVSLSRTVVGSGVENGISYVDIRWNGTPSGNSSLGIDPSARTEIPAAPGQTWTGSIYARVVGGSMTNLTAEVGISERQTADGGAVALVNDYAVVSLGEGPLVAQRFSRTRTLTNALTNLVTLSLRLRVTSGLPVDVTIRVGFPQMEQQPVPTSPIVPPVGTPGVATRARDRLALPAGQFPFERGALAFRAMLARYGSAGVGGANNWLLAAGTSAERVSCNMASDVPGLNIVSGGSAVLGATRPGGTAPRDAFFNGAISWGDGSGRTSWDGAAAVEDASAASPVPVGPGWFVGANWADNANQSTPIIIRYLRVWNRKLTAAQVQRESARDA